MSMNVATLIDTLAQYSFIFSSHIVDYFHNLSWLRYPPEWRAFLSALDSDRCFDLLKTRNVTVLPPSLAEFFRQCESLSLEHCPLKRDFSPITSLDLPRELVLGDSKKRHEVSLLAQLVADLCQPSRPSALVRFPCPWVVDFGAGLSYLGFVLAHHFGLHTAAIESKRERCQRAAVRQEQLVKKIRWTSRKQQGAAAPPAPPSPAAPNDRRAAVHCIAAELPPSLSSAALVGLISPFLAATDGAGADSAAPPPAALPPFCFAALHACGNLSSMALRLFAEVPEAATLCLVGCCYHLLTVEGGVPAPTPRAPPPASAPPLPGFPLSSAVREKLMGAGRAGVAPASGMLLPHVLAQATHSVDRLLGLDDSDDDDDAEDDAEDGDRGSGGRASPRPDPTRHLDKKRRAMRSRGGGPGRFARIVRMNHLRCALQLLFVMCGHPDPKCSVGHLRDHTIPFAAYAKRAFAKLHWTLPRGYADLSLPPSLAASMPPAQTTGEAAAPPISAAEAFYRLSCRAGAPFWSAFEPPVGDDDARTSAFLESFYAGLDEGIIRAVLTLRCLTSPLLESLVLLDRALFLEESRVCQSVSIVSLFDRRQSPRGFALVAIKKSREGGAAPTPAG